MTGKYFWQKKIQYIIVPYENYFKKKSEKISENLVFAGLIGMMDLPRKEVYAAIHECKTAGIKVVMLTGDHPSTAKNIAEKLRLADYDDLLIHGKEMTEYENISEKEKQHWMDAKIFARVSLSRNLIW